MEKLESEYQEYVKTKGYGTPLAVARPGQTADEQDLEKYYAGHSQFLALCAPYGCACPVTICCWTCFFPMALYSYFKESKGKEEAAVESAKDTRSWRFVLFPTMIVKLGKIGDSGVVREFKSLNFLDHPHLTKDVVANIDGAGQDGINGWVQRKFVPNISAVNVYGDKTRRVFTGGDRNNSNNYTNVRVPEIQIMAPTKEAKKFATALQEALRKVKSGDFERPPCMGTTVTDQPPTYDSVQGGK